MNPPQDEQENDRTHRVQLGGKVKIGKILINTDGSEEKEINRSKTLPVPVERSVTIRVVILEGSPVGGDPVRDREKVEQDIRVAEERLGQVGVKLISSIEEISAPTSHTLDGQTIGIIYDDAGGIALNPLGDEQELSDEAKALVGALGADTDTINCIFVPELSRLKSDGSFDAVNGIAFAPYFYNKAEDASYINNFFIDANDPTTADPGKLTLAHELMHLLTNAAHCEDYDAAVRGDCSVNLMTNTGISDEDLSIGSKKRLTSYQQNLIQGVGLAN